MKIKFPFILAFILMILAACDEEEQSNKTVLSAAKWFIESAIDGDIAKNAAINHSEDWNAPADYVIDIANETGVIDIEKENYSLTEIDKRVVAVSFGVVADPWILEFKKDSTGYYFTNFLTPSDYKEELAEIIPQWIIDPIYYEVLSGFNNGLALVDYDFVNKGFINEKGYLTIEDLDYALPFNKGLASFEVEEKWGTMDENGNFLIEPKFDYIGNFHEGLAEFMNQDEKYGFIDKEGNVIIEPMYDYVGDFSEGLAWAEQDRKYGYIDKDGNWAIEPVYQKNGGGNSFSEGLAVVQKNGKYGYINKEGDWVIEPKFEDAGDFHEGLAFVLVKSKKFLFWDSYKYGYINQDGEFVIEPKFNKAFSFYNGAAAVETEDDKIGIINTDGRWVGDTLDGGIYKYENGVLITDSGDLMNTDGKFIETGLNYLNLKEIYGNGEISVCLKENISEGGSCGLIRLNRN